MLPSQAAAASSSSLAEVMTQYPTDMDVDADDGLALIDAHDTPAEKVDADFFNGATPSANLPAGREKKRPHPLPLRVLAQTLRTTLTTRTCSDPSQPPPHAHARTLILWLVCCNEACAWWAYSARKSWPASPRAMSWWAVRS